MFELRGNSIAEHFGEVEDPRADRGKRRELLATIVIASYAVIVDSSTSKIDAWLAFRLGQ